MMGKKFTCSKCPNRTFRKSCSLRWHYKNYHPALEPPTLNKSSDSKFTCEECSVKFNFQINLFRHLKKFHSTQLLPRPITPKKFKCEKCSSEYKSYRNLIRHEQLKHSRPNCQDLPLIPKKFKCVECNSEYTSNRNLKRHERLKHNSWVVKKLTTINCSLCSTSLTLKEDLYNHWKFDHEITLQIDEVELVNKDSFLTWKSNIEIESKAKFIRNISGFSSKSGETVYYQCNRSGYFNSRSKGLRHLKTQGTCKINSICPARMKVRVLENGTHMVQFTKTHIGHGPDLEHYSIKSETENQCENLTEDKYYDITLDRPSNSEIFPVPKKFKCIECSAEYSIMKNLKRHERLKHGSVVTKKNIIVKCSLCSCLTPKGNLYSHWELEHGIQIESEDLELENKDSFFAWKRSIESDTKSKFIRNISGFSSKSGETIYFQCNRSGFFSSKSKGLRQLKNQGSCKINSICPARMKVRVFEDGKHIVQFTKTHVGHGSDFDHLKIEPEPQNQHETSIKNTYLDVICESSSDDLSLISNKFKCTECNARYTNIKSLKRHESLKHSSSLMKKFNIIKCALCSIFVTKKADLFQHWEEEHSINIESEDVELENKDMFLTWKNIIENDTRSKYVRYMSGFSSKSGETLYFQCNRSGYFNSKSKGFRHLKTQGSCKINSICPAGMKVRVLEDGRHLVQFTKTHVGHGHDLGHLSLTQTQREILAKKIASNVPFDAILDDVRESIESDFSYGRIHLLTRKDLHNIRQSFNLIPNDSEQEIEETVYSEFNVEGEQGSLATNMSQTEDEEIAFRLKSSLDSNDSTSAEVTSVDIMKKEVNDYYKKLSDSASSHEELVVIANLLEKAKPLIDTIRLNNGESETPFSEIVIKMEPHNQNV